jgi:hypothetical protein
MLKYNNTFFNIPNILRYKYPKTNMKIYSHNYKKYTNTNENDSYIRIICVNNNVQIQKGFDTEVMYIYIENWKNHIPIYTYKYRYTEYYPNKELFMIEYPNYTTLYHFGNHKLIYNKNTGIICIDSLHDYCCELFFNKYDKLIDYKNVINRINKNIINKNIIKIK